MDKNSTQLVKEFKNPSVDYNPVMMWFWKDKVEEKEITFQLEKFKEQNIRDFFIHPAYGIETEYLSDRYFELIKYTVKEAKRLGMRYWIYDEYEYPSGTAGGELVRDYPEYREHELKVVEIDLCMQGMRVPGIIRKGNFVGAQIVTEKEDGNYVIDITDKCEVTKSGEYTEVGYVYDETNIAGRGLFYFDEVNIQSMPSAYGAANSDGCPGYMDMLNPKAIQKFIELTHERYKKWIGDEFGKTVIGVFTDEPTTLRHFDGQIAGLWSENFLDMFYEDHGYDLRPYLYVLWSVKAKSPEEIKAVYDYRETLKTRYQKVFHEQIANWCKDNNLIFTGHFGGEEDVGGYLFQGDMLKGLMKLHMPGIDAIVCSQKIDTEEFTIAPKLGASAAKFMGSDRLLCETYTGSGWYFRLDGMKRVANRILSMGVNMIQYMGAYYTLDGMNKNFPSCYAPSHSYNNTLFKHYGKFNDYIAAFSALSAATKPAGNILLFNPVCECMFEYYTLLGSTKQNPFRTFYQKTFMDTVNAMLFEGMDFDLFSEDDADKIKVYDDYIEVYGYKYDTLVFPAMKFINEKTEALIKKLQKSNVKTVFALAKPETIANDGKKTDFDFDFVPYSQSAGIKKDGNIYLIESEKFPVDIDIYREAFRETVGKAVLNMTSDGRIYIAKRANSLSEVYFINNDDNKKVTVFLDALPGLEIYSAETRDKAEYTVKNGRIEIVLNPYEMVAGIRDLKSNELPVGIKPVNYEQKDIVLGNEYDFVAESGNMLPLIYEMYDEDTGLWDKCDYMCFSSNIHMKRRTDYKMRAYVNFDFIPEKVYINVETKLVKKLKVNGKELKLEINARRWTPQDYTEEIAALLNKGENLIEMEAVSSVIAAYTRPPFIFLSGDFRLDDNLTVIPSTGKVSVGGWEKDGYKYYSGDGIYTCHVNVNDDFKAAKLQINCLDVAKITVNGKDVREKMWMPDDTDITSYLKKGDNTIEIRVTSTYANLFGCKWFDNLSDVINENGILKPMILHLYK